MISRMGLTLCGSRVERLTPAPTSPFGLSNPALSSFNALQATLAPTSDTLDPSGGNGAFKLNDDTSATEHLCYQTGTVVRHGLTEWSCFAKPGTKHWIVLEANEGVGYTYFDLSAGRVGYTQSGVIYAAIVRLANGWFKIASTFLSPSSGLAFAINLSVGDGPGMGGEAIYNGDGTGTAYLYGPRVVLAMNRIRRGF